MRLVITGGGTGGHVYPALEVASLAQEESELLYLGSLRGMEGSACEAKGISFRGFASEPVYKALSLTGAQAILKLFLASLEAKKELKRFKPDVVFSTGGYSSAPIMRAAKSLNIPLAIHACDTVPGRALRMFADYSSSFTSSFEHTRKVIGEKVVRTGHPVRIELRRALESRKSKSAKIVVLGGSGGAKFLNETIPLVAKQTPDVEFVLAAGRKQFDSYINAAQGISNLIIVPYLEQPELIDSLQTSTLAIGRSGSGISEFAVARIPSILIPLPTSADDHQLHNAIEFMNFGGSSILTQSGGAYPQATAESISENIREWTANPERIERAEQELSKWDQPNATAAIWQEIKKVASR
jgi:UDP-N-acetylglucosamine--N-acetylmuramyl-(pentapeptide) pyrophosphoryl-undecaprenol N-acetylglucosamine transferase